MKLQTNQLQQFYQGVGKNYISCLLHGPDYGVRADIADSISEKFLGSEFAHNVINLDFSNPENTTSVMFSEMMNYDLIPERKVIKIKSPTNKITPSIQQIIDKHDAINKDVFLIIIAEDLDAKSTLRTLYEGSDMLGSIGCYADMPQDLAQMVVNFFNQNNIKFDLLVPKFIASKFIGDRISMKNELSKISVFLDKDEVLTLDLCQKIIDESLSYAPDIFLDSVGIGDFNTASIELERALKEGENPVSIIRFMVFHFSKIKDMLSNISRGSSADQEISKARIFFKRIPSYKKQLSILNLKKVNILLSKLLSIEKSLKTYNEEVGLLIFRKSLYDL